MDTNVKINLLITLLSELNLTAYGKINTTLGPQDFLKTSVAFRIFHLRPSVSAGEFESDFGPKEILYRPHVVVYNAEAPDFLAIQWRKLSKLCEVHSARDRFESSLFMKDNRHS